MYVATSLMPTNLFNANQHESKNSNFEVNFNEQEEHVTTFSEPELHSDIENETNVVFKDEPISIIPTYLDISSSDTVNLEVRDISMSYVIASKSVGEYIYLGSDSFEENKESKIIDNLNISQKTTNN